MSRTGRGIGGATLCVVLVAAACTDPDPDDGAAELTVVDPAKTIETIETTTPPPPAADAEDPVPDTAVDDGGDYIDLPYFEGVILDGLDLAVAAGDECDRSEPRYEVCDLSMAFKSIGTLIGRSNDTQSGSVSTDLGSSCGEHDGGHLSTRTAEGMIVTANSDEVYFANQAVGCTAPGGPRYSGWVVTGGTGRFEGAHGVMHGLEPPLSSGFASSSLGTIRVQRELWEDAFPPGVEMELPPTEGRLELPYWERFQTDFRQEATGDCDESDPSRTVCPYRSSGNMEASLIGHAYEEQAGTITTLLDETCGRGDSHPQVQDGSGTITSESGDTLSLEVRMRSCPPAGIGTFIWVVTGGTGRFEGAYGIFSGMAPVLENGAIAITTGTLSVEAERWADVVPDQRFIPDLLDEAPEERRTVPYFEIMSPDRESLTAPCGGDACYLWIHGDVRATHLDSGATASLPYVSAAELEAPCTMADGSPGLATELIGDYGQLSSSPETEAIWSTMRLSLCASGESLQVHGLLDVTGGRGVFEHARGRLSLHGDESTWFLIGNIELAGNAFDRFDLDEILASAMAAGG